MNIDDLFMRICRFELRYFDALWDQFLKFQKSCLWEEIRLKSRLNTNDESLRKRV